MLPASLPGRDGENQRVLRPLRPLRLALPHRRARGQRDDAGRIGSAL